MRPCLTSRAALGFTAALSRNARVRFTQVVPMSGASRAGLRRALCWLTGSCPHCIRPPASAFLTTRPGLAMPLRMTTSGPSVPRGAVNMECS